MSHDNRKNKDWNDSREFQSLSKNVWEVSEDDQESKFKCRRQLNVFQSSEEPSADEANRGTNCNWTQCNDRERDGNVLEELGIDWSSFKSNQGSKNNIIIAKIILKKEKPEKNDSNCIVKHTFSENEIKECRVNVQLLKKERKKEKLLLLKIINYFKQWKVRWWQLYQ